MFEPDADRQTAPVVLDEIREEEAIHLRMRLPEDLFYFKGHFDGAPILPGVVQIDWAVRFAETHFGLKPTLQRIEVLKFFDILTKNREIQLTLQYDDAQGRLNFLYDLDGKKYSSGRLMFEVPS